MGPFVAFRIRFFSICFGAKSTTVDLSSKPTNRLVSIGIVAK